MSNELKEMVDECLQPLEPSQYQAECKLDESQLRLIERYRCDLSGDLYGVTVGRMRFITDGAICINAISIVNTDAWEVFKHLFKTLGDGWFLEQWDSKAIQKEPMNSVPGVQDAIDAWKEDADELQYVATVDGLAIHKNKKGEAVFIADHYFKFADNLSFSLDDVDSPIKPVCLTHIQSCGFAGLVMPCRLTGNKKDVMLRQLKSAVKLLKEVE